jgi:hypothetical protein
VSEKESLAAEQLAMYLNDHLAGSVAAIELLDSLIEQHSEDRFGKTLGDLRNDIHNDQEILRDLMRKVGARESAVRKAGAWLVEKLSRVKIGDADDSAALLQALEGLALGIAGKQLLWRSLKEIASSFASLQGTDFNELEERAQTQFACAENLRMQMVRESFRD